MQDLAEQFTKNAQEFDSLMVQMFTSYNELVENYSKLESQNESLLAANKRMAEELNKEAESD